MEVTIEREQQEEDNIFRKGNILESTEDGRVVIVTSVMVGSFDGTTLYVGSGKTHVGASVFYNKIGFKQFNGTLTIKI